MAVLRTALVLLLLAASAGFAQTPPADTAPGKRSSLLFTAGEQAAILKALSEVGRQAPAASQTEPAEEETSFPNIYVSAVAQFGPGQWTVWANGYRIVPGRQAPGFQVLAVHDDGRVEIIVPGDPPARFTLQPHQTWMAQSESIVEGIVP